MITSYFSVWDKKARAYAQLFPAVTAGAAERSFSEALKAPDSLLGKYPSDFCLYRVFDFDDDTGSVVNVFDPPMVICEALSLVSL
jgi:hypothetical protein